ncbi:MAG: tRNA (adenosine(37)-N6)-threonylcarbamoyltransferase complex transferase subunit TsaD [Defluviitaleaceae bacterium]|nr:tRNA (adenosine(37)-N6)-threonylcarbamoyltransferase complex transferase subunit TsaD [Defluviitaleaceae bacterium]MCL2837345.1 tRNA (adenosine(37)-N6)-threonylcarbamoyltransferase complex transferase subunit TsaD [Defluviitaleaceae bacterium]
MKNTLILGIETSCDETCAAVIKNGREVLSNVVYSQIDIHRKYGGVVPEIASRNHIERIDDVMEEALETAGVNLTEMDAVAVTYGPGLVGALLVGLSYGKALAYAAKKPLIAVHHIEGHICANYIADPCFTPPYVALVVSGGHTSFVCVNDYTEYTLLGSTRDDAAGEAFDKAARMLDLPYPGGVEIEKLAAGGNPHAVKFPRAATENPLDCSFSGLKSAVAGFIQKNRDFPKADIAASFQEAVADVLVGRAITACHMKNSKILSLSGGVAANKYIRRRMTEACEREGLFLQIPPIALCTDNAAMIASAGYFRFVNGEIAGLDLNAYPGLELTT